MFKHITPIITRALRGAATVATVAVSAALLFGNSAWAPTDVYVDGSLADTNWSTAAGHYAATNVRTTVLKWPSSSAGWPAKSDGSPAAGTPCSWTSLRPGERTNKVIHAVGSNRTCY
jgi:hypothetical protein